MDHVFGSSGSAGSNRLRSAILQTISNVIDFGKSVDQAIGLPRIHYESGMLHVEPGSPAADDGSLGALGFKVKPWRKLSLFFGGVQAVVRQDGNLDGAGDPRRHGACIAVE